jgi:hypothetical protein
MRFNLYNFVVVRQKKLVVVNYIVVIVISLFVLLIVTEKVQMSMNAVGQMGQGQSRRGHRQCKMQLEGQKNARVVNIRKLAVVFCLSL